MDTTTKPRPVLARLLQDLDKVVQPQQRPSLWPLDGVVALLVASVAYPATIHMNYRAKWTRDAVSHWTGRKDITAVTISSLLYVLDRYDEEERTVAYLHTDAVVGRAFGRYKYEADHGYLTQARNPMVFRCSRNACIVSNDAENCTPHFP